MADLSLIIVHWNVPELLDACLTSISAQLALPQLEVIVVDSASDRSGFDETVERHRVDRVLRLAENGGYAAGCNRGMEAARGSAMLLLNPDVELLPGAIDSLWTALRLAPHVGMVAPLLLNSDGSLQSAGYRYPGVINVALDLFPTHPRLVGSSVNGRLSPGDGRSPYRIDYPLGAAMMVRREAWQDVGPLDEDYGMYSEEIDWAKRFAGRGWTILAAPAARVVHHGGRSTAQQPEAMRLKLWESRARYFERWGTRWQRRAIAGMVRARLALPDRSASTEASETNRRIRERFARPAGGRTT